MKFPHSPITFSFIHSLRGGSDVNFFFFFVFESGYAAQFLFSCRLLSLMRTSSKRPGHETNLLCSRYQIYVRLGLSSVGEMYKAEREELEMTFSNIRLGFIASILQFDRRPSVIKGGITR